MAPTCPWELDSSTLGVLLESMITTPLSPSTIPSIDEIRQRGRDTVIIVQNVNGEWQERLRSQLGIDQRFFDRHNNDRPRSDDLQTEIFGLTVDQQRRPETDRQIDLEMRCRHDQGLNDWYQWYSWCWHVDGILALDGTRNQMHSATHRVPSPDQRRLTYHPLSGWHTSTRISVSKQGQHLCEFVLIFARTLSATTSD